MAGSKMTKTQFIAAISEGAHLDKKQVTAFLDSLTNLIKQQLGKGGPGELTIPGLIRLKAKETAAQPAQEKKNPFTGAVTMGKAKPASRKVRATPIKALKDLISKT